MAITKASTPPPLCRLVLKGYKSIAACDIELQQINLLIGANGAGKSNFIGFFGLIREILKGQLQLATGGAGGPDALLHFGQKETESLDAEIYFGHGPDANSYRFSLRPTQGNRMMFAHESLWWGSQHHWQGGAGHLESEAGQARSVEHLRQVYDDLLQDMQRWRVYHFHDTSPSARVKQIHGLNDNEYLRDDARNLAAFLYRLKQHHAKHYHRIVKSVQLVAPFFGDFHLRPTVGNQDKIQLEWTESGHDEPFHISALSDGTLRFICLATALLQPPEFMPATILIDEPELGLHPYAINVLAALIRSASQDHQLIVSTQSIELLNGFDLEHLIVIDRRGGPSTLRRPDAQALAQWLDEYSLGELWNKNLLGGRPAR